MIAKLQLYWPYIAPALGYLLINIGNALAKLSPGSGRTRKTINRLSLTTSRNKKWSKLKLPMAKEPIPNGEAQ
jgi:hypothetical protein